MSILDTLGITEEELKNLEEIVELAKGEEDIHATLDKIDIQALEHLLQEYKELQANWDTLKDYVEDEFSNIPQGDQEEEQWLMMIDKIKELESEEVN